MAFGNLPDPPKTRAQSTVGVAANAEHEHLLTKLVYFSQNGGVDAFPVTVLRGQRFGDSCLASTCSMRPSTSSTFRTATIHF